MKRLVLFDIDGTLLTARRAPRRAFERALVEVYGTAGPIATHRFDGKTDPQIARELLKLEGVADAAIDEGFAGLWAAYVRELRHELRDPLHETVVHAGVPQLLEALAAVEGGVLIGILTGNIREGAALKLESAGLASAFSVGAFGSDCERRDGLPPIAVERARSLTGRAFRRREIVVIGDTPDDVTCGRALDVTALGVTTGSFDEAALRAAGAHDVFADLSDTARVLRSVLAEG
jgi:phosphoglycolate phosphatase-like HAD superfamily hydrolase